MKYFGVDQYKKIKPLWYHISSYQARDFHVEAFDWSAASYFYTIAGLANSADITLHGLHQDSFCASDGDIVKSPWEKFNLEIIYGDHQVRICKKRI
ncbi:MAG: hypothetical protein IPP49_06990 [Saprospiraceae bacterium]|nr:hypothetical protein [Saprospiraceae bacterium]